MTVFVPVPPVHTIEPDPAEVTVLFPVGLEAVRGNENPEFRVKVSVSPPKSAETELTPEYVSVAPKAATCTTLPPRSVNTYDALVLVGLWLVRKWAVSPTLSERTPL